MIEFAFYKKSAPRANWADEIISWWTNGPYSHVELIIDGVMYSSSPRDGYVRCKPHIYDPLSWDYIDVSVSDRDIDRIKKFFTKTENRKYDWLGILGFIIPVHDSEQKYFCSEWCTKAGIIGGIECLYDKNPSRMSPNRLAYTLLKAGYKRVKKIGDGYVI
jgi:hypothetical protein